MLDEEDIDAIARRVAALVTPAPEQYIKADEAAVLLQVPKTWLLAEARADRVPHVRFGRYVRFSSTALLDWAQDCAPGPRARDAA